MRGKVKGLALMGGNPRITPAYAGKSAFVMTVHRKKDRITPAYAGKS